MSREPDNQPEDRPEARSDARADATERESDQIAGAAADALDLRLGNVRAELTGHVPAPDRRLEALFLTGHAPADHDRQASPAPPLAEIGGHPQDQGLRPRRVAVTAIAACSVLLAGVVGFAVSRSGSTTPVEVTADSADTPGLLVGDASEHSPADTVDQPGDASPGSESFSGDDPDGNDGARGDDSGHAVDDNDDDGAAGHDDDGRDLADDGHHPFGDLGADLHERLEGLWADNEAWIDCVTSEIDDWIDDWIDDRGDGSWVESMEALETRCGSPSLDGFGELELDIPYLELGGLIREFFPDGVPDLDRDELCKKLETDDGVAITCRWPPCPLLDGESAGSQLAPDDEANGLRWWPFPCDWPPCPDDSRSGAGSDTEPAPEAGADDEANGLRWWPFPCDWPPCPDDSDSGAGEAEPDRHDSDRFESGRYVPERNGAAFPYRCRIPPCEHLDDGGGDAESAKHWICPPIGPIPLPPLSDLPPLDELLPPDWPELPSWPEWPADGDQGTFVIPDPDFELRLDDLGDLGDLIPEDWREKLEHLEEHLGEHVEEQLEGLEGHLDELGT